ncbi:lysozyme [Phenylobacterium sp.]|uniref:lysozyme n=1 Tax=Phenylobacterium sp. TaxID=1871053 RepID=UPI003568D290
MQPRHRVSRAAIELIKRFEGYRRAAAQLPDGRWTIGHGHTLTARQGAQVSEDDAEALLLYDLIAIAHALNEAVFAPLNQNQFDALASFTFNIGLDNFHRSGVLRRLNEGAPIQAACAMELWRKAEVAGERIVVDALVRRRACEKTLFLTPEGDAWVPAPSPLLRPLLDSDAQGLVPRDAPVDVTTALDGDTIVMLREDAPTPAPAPPEYDSEDPARTAAEAVSARLSTIFQDPGEEPAPEEPAPEEPVSEEAHEEAEVRPQPHPERIPEDPHPQDDFGMPSFAPLEDPVPFFLRAPEPQDETPEAETDDAERDEANEHRGRDLFDPAPANDLADNRAEDEAADGAESQRERTVIDDSAPFEFVPPAVQPLPPPSQGGMLTLVALAVLGLIFFGGGIFWAANARPVANSEWFGPRLVGGLAGIAGVGFFVVAIYFLLDRLGRASERRARQRR